ncbi:MAG: hypothetical protein OXE58_08555 [Acidobacteria bacterium]|nr:hypothetical protein [Acidobacteriota bacterium]
MQATKDVSPSGVFSDAVGDSVHEHFQALVYVSSTAITTAGDPFRSPEGAAGAYVTVTDGSDDGSQHGGL